ncbi:MAG: hypothetical protein QM478_02615 [Flavobacteriaceae bacterium]
MDLSFQSYAIEGWFKVDIIPSAGEYPHIFGVIDGPSDAGFVRINGDSNKLEFVIKSDVGYKTVTSPEVIQAGIWYHAAILLHKGSPNDVQYLLINGEVVAYNQFPSIDTYSNSLFGIGGDGIRNFDGLDANVWCPSITPTVTSRTIEFWVNLDVIPTDNARLISRGANYSAGDEIYLLNNDGGIYTEGSLVVGDDLQSTNPLPTDVWTHVAITADGSGSKLYINGILDDTGGCSFWF